MYKKYYIKDFVEDFNYSGVILYVSDSVNLEHLRAKLKKDNLNHLSRFDDVLLNRMFYIENCDLQIISSESELFDNDYSVKILYKDKNGYFIRLEVLQWSSKKNILHF